MTWIKKTPLQSNSLHKVVMFHFIAVIVMFDFFVDTSVCDSHTHLELVLALSSSHTPPQQ